MGQDDQRPLFKDEQACAFLLDSIGASSRLDIRASRIPGAGSALFTRASLADGDQVFQSRPLVSAVLDTTQNVCDWCFRDAESRVLPSGQFRSIKDAVDVFTSCSRCRVTRYCSQSCLEAADSEYHRHECSLLLSANRSMHAKTRALYRMLLQRSHNLVPHQLWQLVHKMESHWAARMSTSGADEIRDIAATAKAETGSSESVQDISRLYCILLTNNICVQEAAQSKVLGSALDVAMSLMNHSCEPNVVTVFEGNRLHVRALRPIQAGEELLQCYTDETCDVLLRRRKLAEQYHFVCECRRCLHEFAFHKAWTAGDATRMALIQDTQEKVTHVINASLVAFASSEHHRRTAVSALESQVLALTVAASPPGAHWPRTLDPLPTLYKRLAVMSSTVGQSLAALRYSVKGCAYTQVRCGPDWAKDLLELVRLLVPVASNARQLGEEMPIRPAELWVVFIGCLHVVAVHARKLYGETSAFTRAVERWLGEILTSPSLLSTAGFQRKLKTAHSKLLDWAGVESESTAWVL